MIRKKAIRLLPVLFALLALASVLHACGDTAGTSDKFTIVGSGT